MSQQGFYKTILVPVDGSETSQRAVDAARELTGAGGAEVILLSVAVDRDVMPSELMATGHISSKNIQDERRQQAAGIAQQAARTLQDAGITAKDEVATGDPAHCIIERARELNAPLVIIGRRGLTGFRELLMGSVSNKVVHYADCPVLVIN
ncbi:universal stress protein [Halomonas sp. DQ26W]|uniref:universal stress protein n=1 Tax=Halomonas sp. DQ26W TaxID=2282311 RepID=UPI000DF752FE|nr:universal stress protein [Halomonas sp. DQ26W]RDB41968.1 universal stress protein [Halomonas sp. DQ26W]